MPRKQTVGDAVFFGINDGLKAEALPQGVGALAVNARFREGVCETRGGILPLISNIKESASFPLQFPIRWTQNRSPLGEIIEVAPYEKPGNFASQIFLVDDDGVILAYRTRYSHRAQEIPINGDPAYTAQFRLVPAQDKLVLLSTDGHFVLSNFQDGFEPMAAAEVGFSPPPQVGYGIYMGSRLLIPNRDEIWFSNTLNFANYNINGRIFVNQGDSDAIVALAPFGTSSIIVFKESSIYLLGNVVGPSDELNSRVIVSLLTKSFGIIAKDSLAHDGKNLIFLTRQGVHSVGLTSQNELHTSSVPLSEPIDGFMGRVNWAYAGSAFGEVSDNKYYLALPIDGSTESNAVLVFDLLRRFWNGYDDTQVKKFYRSDYAGAERLHSVNHASNVFLYDYGSYDYALLDNEDPHSKLIPKRNPVRWLRTDRGRTIETNQRAGIEVLTAEESAQTMTRLEKITEIQQHLSDEGITSSISGSVSGSISGATGDSLYVRVDGNIPVEDDLATTVSAIEAKDWEYMPIPVTFVTREYRLRDELRATELSVEADSLNAGYWVYIIVDGEEQKLLDYRLTSLRRSFNRTKYVTLKADYDLRNPNESFSLPNREDYSLVLHDDGTQIGGTELAKYTSYTDRRDISKYGRTVQVKIVNNSGRIKIRRVAIKCLRGETDKILKG